MNLDPGQAADDAAPEAGLPADAPPALAFVHQLGEELSSGTLHLPSFPEAVMRIRQVVSDPDATTHDVVRAVQGEPVFTAKLYRMANSVMLQRGNQPVTDLHAIVTRIGFDTLKHLAVALATRQIMNARKYEALHAQLGVLWEHSVKTAAIAFVLARDSGEVSTDDALLTGLIHDIGVFYVYSRMSRWPALFEDREAVSDILADWHTGVGRAILEAWEFQETIVEAVDEHETFDRTHVGHADLTDVVIVANLLAHRGGPTEKPVDLAGVPALERLKLTPESALASLERSRSELDTIRGVLR